MALLFIVFAAALGVGTFIENDHGTDAARILIYNSRWFELLMVLFIINFVLNVRKYGLTQKKKWSILTIHLSLVVIILGAFVSRYYGFTGLISIREGQTNDEMLSDDTFLNVVVESEKDGKVMQQTITKKVLLSQATPRHNEFSIRSKFDGEDIVIRQREFVENADLVFVENADGPLYLKLVETKNGERFDRYIKDGEIARFGNTTFTLNNPVPDAINFQVISSKFFLRTSFSGSLFSMGSGETRNVRTGIDTVALKSLYTFDNAQFVVPDRPKPGNLKLTAKNSMGSDELDGALKLEISRAGDNQEITVLGKRRKMGDPRSFVMDGLKYTVTYGSRIYKLPFQIELQNFIAERYPGTTNSYSAFESRVRVIDKGGDFNARIYMNHVLDHRGYRFFQASYHPDEKGTILAVNHDRLGTWITYAGYFILYFGLIMMLFGKYTRFGRVMKRINTLDRKKTALTGAMVLIFATFGFAGGGLDSFGPHFDAKVDSLIHHYKTPEDLASKFGRLVVQDLNGRMKPINTYSSEVLRKISKSDVYGNLDADQALLSMIQFPEVWYNVPLIYVASGNDSIRELIGAPFDHKLIPLSAFFESDGRYKIGGPVNDAYKAMVPNQFEKDFIEVDRRVNLLYNMLGGRDLRMFPVPGNAEHKWIPSSEVSEYGDVLSMGDSLFIAQVMSLYNSSFISSVAKGNFKETESILDKIAAYQIKFGGDVRPSKSQIDTEVWYNRYDVFKSLFAWYLYAGVAMLIVAVIALFKMNRVIKTSLNVLKVGVLLCFAMHTLGLIARWYVSGHAPWSDAYESIIYISWATMLFGLIIGRKSDLALAATAFVTSMILMVAHWNWMDPAIANLEPVLNSYWLMIHVAIIVASYGPFTLGMILSVLSLILMVFLTGTNKKRLGLNITKLVLLTEVTLTVGLVMLTIGNFLGGQWANESWGRYWAWDPKETWALTSIVLYALIIHLRLIPKLSGKWLFAMMGALGYYAILMTYFGVNFYLSGLHSYAKGENIVTPNAIYYSLLGIGILGVVSFYKYKKFMPQSRF